MTPQPRAVAPAGVVHRLGRRPDPWAWPDWAFATDDATFGSRYDDPLGAYRVLYASTQRLGVFLETLARFRPDPAVVAALAEIAPDPGEPSDATLPAGTVPRRWLADRAVGRGRLMGSYCEIAHSDSLAWLRTAMAARLVHYGLADLDAASVRLSVPRRFTQEIGRRIYELADERGERRFAGLRYLSRLGDEIENWAIFEPAEILDQGTEALEEGDPDFAEALERLGLTLR